MGMAEAQDLVNRRMGLPPMTPITSPDPPPSMWQDFINQSLTYLPIAPLGLGAGGIRGAPLGPPRGSPPSTAVNMNDFITAQQRMRVPQPALPGLLKPDLVGGPRQSPGLWGVRSGVNEPNFPRRGLSAGGPTNDLEMLTPYERALIQQRYPGFDKP
jgi:hypothetical protein